MEPRQLIVVPQLEMKMRYSEWWPKAMKRYFKETELFENVHILRQRRDFDLTLDEATFSRGEESLYAEADQVQMYLELMKKYDPKQVTLLHCDLSWPGLFHQVLFHRKPAHAVAICHGTARNHFDVFEPCRRPKWNTERGHAKMYDRVVVATEYHKEKLGWKNVVSLGALPSHPLSGETIDSAGFGFRTHHFVSTARLCRQKVNGRIEKALRKRTGSKVKRHTFSSWEAYYRFLSASKFLVVTSREETYGYQVVEAVARGCVPIAPRAFSYPELLPDECLYEPNPCPMESAMAIISVAEAFENSGEECPGLKNQEAIDNVWESLTKVLEPGA